MLGVFQDLVGQAGFDNPPVLHDNGAASEQADDPEVMGDHHHRGTQFLLDLKNQVEDACLYREVQARGDLIEEQQRWLRGECLAI